MSPLKLFTLAPRESQFVLAVAELHNHLGFENSTEQDLIAKHGTANVRCLGGDAGHVVTTKAMCLRGG